jgi:hypothetical protein
VRRPSDRRTPDPTPPGARTGRRLGAAVVILVMVAAGCGGTSGTDAADAPAGGAQLFADLCAAHEAGDAETAAERFGAAHGPLHDLAREAQASDRRAAAELLEAKQRVESALAGGEQARLDQRLGDLVVAARAASEAVGSPAPPCSPSP